MRKFFKEFGAFIKRGNVLDMAVGVVIGGAFGKIVTGLVNYIINPCVSLLTNGTDLDSVKTVLVKGVEATDTTEAVPEIAILWGTWFQTILDFLIVAFFIFLVLRVMVKMRNKLDAKRIAEEKAKAEAEKVKAEEAKAAADAAAQATKDRQTAVEDAILRQEKLLAELVAATKKK